MLRQPGSAEQPKAPLPIDRARQLTKPFAGDDGLDRWAARMIAAADDFQKNKRPDPLGGFVSTHQR